jgi:carbon-monoxide dehydrogenase iron sulfur subunit
MTSSEKQAKIRVPESRGQWDLGENSKVNGKKPSRILITNPRACIGCRTCELFCSFQHYNEQNPARALLQVLKDETSGIDYPVICRHCDKPKCVEACYFGAIKRDPETGAVLIDHKLCVGCKNCISACPFGAIRIDPKTGYVTKCDLCGGDPYCAKMCKQGAIIYVEKTVAPSIFAHNAAAKPLKVLASENKKN